MQLDLETHKLVVLLDMYSQVSWQTMNFAKPSQRQVSIDVAFCTQWLLDSKGSCGCAGDLQVLALR